MRVRRRQAFSTCRYTILHGRLRASISLAFAINKLHIKQNGIAAVALPGKLLRASAAALVHRFTRTTDACAPSKPKNLSIVPLVGRSKYELLRPYAPVPRDQFVDYFCTRINARFRGYARGCEKRTIIVKI